MLIRGKKERKKQTRNMLLLLEFSHCCRRENRRLSTRRGFACKSVTCRFMRRRISARDRAISLSVNTCSSESYVYISERRKKKPIQSLICVQNPFEYPARRRCCCLAAPYLVPRVHAKRMPSLIFMSNKPSRTLCQNHKTATENPPPETVVTNPEYPEPFSQSCCLGVRSFQGRQGRDQRSKYSIRAAACIAGSLSEFLLRVSLLLKFRNTSAPRINKPIADLFTNVSSFPMSEQSY